MTDHYEESHAIHVWKQAALRRWWDAPGRLTNPFASSWLLRSLLGNRLSLRLLFIALFGLSIFLLYQGFASAAFGIALAILAYSFPHCATLLLPSTLIFSPRLTLFELGDEQIFWRLDHALLFGLFFYCCRNQRFRPSALHAPLLIYSLVLVLSVLSGMAQHTLTNPALSLIYLAHWAHLILVFVCVHAMAKELGEKGLYAWGLPVIAAAAYGISEAYWPMTALPEIRYRSFERVFFDGQANHFAGLFVIAVGVGLALVWDKRRRTFAALLILVSLGALTTTLSRTGFIAMAALPGSWIWIKFPRLRGPLLFAGLLLLMAIPNAIWYRFSAPGSSMFDRLVAWKSALSTLPDYPLLGLGIGARHRSFYDSHYFLTLAESGIVGLGALLWWMASMARALAQGAQRCVGREALCCLGAFIAFAGASVHALASVAFIISVLAGPLLWWCAYALAQAEEEG